MDRTEAAELADRLLAALEYLDDVGSKITPDQASASFDDASLQVFWRDWPRISGWAGALWRNLNTDLAAPSTEARDADLDEVGGEGG
jgi:hypothetical protein